MAIRIVREKGDEALREQARPVRRFDATLERLVEDMFETMYHYNGIGLAAPQIGISKRIIVIDVDDERLALINPAVVEAEGEEVDVEGCLSIPGVYGEVRRFSRIKVKAMNTAGEEVWVAADGLLSRCLQHEIDHLLGVLFVDKVIRYIQKEELLDDAE